MSTEIEDHTIGSDLKATPDEIWAAFPLEDTGTITSSEFLFGQVVGGMEVKVTVDTAFTLPDAEDLVFEFLTATETAGSFSAYATQTLTGGTGGTAYVAGDELFRYVPDREMVDQIYTKIAITTASDLIAGKVDAYLVSLTR